MGRRRSVSCTYQWWRKILLAIWSHTHTNSNCKPYSDRYTNGDSYTDTNAYSHAYSDANADSGPYSDTDANAAPSNIFQR